MDCFIGTSTIIITHLNLLTVYTILLDAKHRLYTCTLSPSLPNCISVLMAKSRDRVLPYVPKKLEPDEIPPDYAGLLSLVFGLVAFYLRAKVCSWVALFLWLNSVATAQTRHLDWKQTFMAFSFSVFSLCLNYFGPASYAN